MMMRVIDAGEATLLVLSVRTLHYRGQLVIQVHKDHNKEWLTRKHMRSWQACYWPE